MMMAFLSAPPPPTFHQTSFQRPYPLNFSSISLIKYPSKSTIALSTSSSSSTVEDEPPASPIPVPSESSISAVEGSPFRGCKVCGREELERGCNGEGRIQGGIATVPGFGWWPIKAYRPCPGFLESGGRYRRSGQSMDEVVTGSGRKSSPVGTRDVEAESSKKNLGPKKFKR